MKSTGMCANEALFISKMVFMGYSMTSLIKTIYETISEKNIYATNEVDFIFGLI